MLAQNPLPQLPEIEPLAAHILEIRLRHHRTHATALDAVTVRAVRFQSISAVRIGIEGCFGDRIFANGDSEWIGFFRLCFRFLRLGLGLGLDWTTTPFWIGSEFER